MKYVILSVFMMTISFCFSQSEQKNYEEVAVKFQSEYNKLNYDGIHSMLDEAMESLIPKGKMTDFMNTVRSNFGMIKTMRFYDINNSAHVYRTTFEKAVVDISFSLNKKNQITGLFIPRNSFENSSVLKRNATKMIFPFKEEAFVYWGGKTEDVNYHMTDLNQQYALDILMVANGAPYKGDSTKNESYFVFGRDIIAPCDAKVVKVIDGIKDNVPGEVNRADITGNTIILETERKEYLLFAHIKMNSILFKEGDWVKQGQVIAKCGNSGNTTQAHLHFQLQNTNDLFNTIGAELYFDEIIVNGEIKKDYMPKKEDFVINKKRITD
ncbi:DUF3887 domain-containing protein [Winogradskyella alexanderae]|uniref:Peptidoglycan DD-metalloendopeptidase family protein n=1 Tax=Winogradskyella alexanderae TaxID=2877123 RepID=A0ABS7XYP2_9FLAO|nr:peptidoglycan DD-metalloendopeptidase family protein [Winogradskyella alexanderae]MCA0133916.1 peptidoglycan DD-metalloendopeptidase family protein [Winogradskyella alexanderae]